LFSFYFPLEGFAEVLKKYLYLVATDQARGFEVPLIRVLLRIFSAIYKGLLICWDGLFRLGLLPRVCLSKPTISVGNITLGGVGKTPLVEMLCLYLKEKGLRPAVLTRGYGGSGAAGTDQETGGNDEALLLRQALPDVPVGVNQDRVAAAKEIFKTTPADVFLLDDGFQHRRVVRDLDIVAIDATNPFGNGRLIPAGILREPISALKRADIFVITKTDLGQANMEEIRRIILSFNAAALIAETVHAPTGLEEFPSGATVAIEDLQEQVVASFCSIGSPESFEKTLFGLGLKVKRNFVFLDHHWYTPQDIQGILDYCREQKITAIITTAKDAVKLKSHAGLLKNGPRCFILKMEIRFIKGKDELLGRIDSVLHR
jgi:tetraacyldisaccharide 4'-kinase